MAWINIENFLEKFRELKPPKKFIEDETVKTINIILNISLKTEDIDYRNGIIYIKPINSNLKNEIFMKKEKILEELSKKFKKRAPRDIRF